jgi:cysteine synthase A
MLRARRGWAESALAFVPIVLGEALPDEVPVITDDEAFDAARRVAREEGILAAVSDVPSTPQLARATDEKCAGQTIVVLPANTAERYVTTELCTS